MEPKKKVLIIEDDPLVTQAYKTIIASAGHEVFVATDGQEGLKAANELKPSLIILDILMPVMDGIEFLKQYEPKKHPETKIVILSNSASADSLKEALSLGATEYMIKSDVKPESIKTVVNGLLASMPASTQNTPPAN